MYLVLLGARALGPEFLSGRVLRTPSWHFARWLKLWFLVRIIPLCRSLRGAFRGNFDAKQPSLAFDV